MTDISVPLEELPTFLATICMVTDDRRKIVQSLTRAERKSPARYEPARQIFFLILTGKLTYEAGVSQAKVLPDSTERECAIGVLRACRQYLKSKSFARAETLAPMVAEVGELELRIAPVWVLHGEENRLLVLHFWQTPLTPRQFGAAGTILKAALAEHHPRYAGLEIDFVSVAVSERTERRQFDCRHWKTLRPLDEAQMSKFVQDLGEAWAAYQEIGPRPIKRRPRKADLFD